MVMEEAMGEGLPSTSTRAAPRITPSCAPARTPAGLRARLLVCLGRARVSSSAWAWPAAPNCRVCRCIPGIPCSSAPGGAKRPSVGRRRPQSDGARGRQDGGYGPVTALFFALISMVALVGMLIRVLAPAKGSREERVGSMLTDIGCYVSSVMVIIVFFPSFVIELRGLPR